MMYLDDSINHEKISNMSLPQLKELCRELRGCILRTVNKTGGHLSSNLGTVELTVALHYIFDVSNDRIVWDVGHQAYAHKLLTGRYSKFSTLRSRGGISGFARRSESEADAFVSGHSSTSISAACGIAAAMKLSGKKASVAAVIGDGAFTGGMAYEGLNNAAKIRAGLVMVLNDNAMSISKSTGALARYLTHIRTTRKYYCAKEQVKSALSSVPLVGARLEKAIRTAKNMVKDALYGTSTLFENLGCTYIGPVNGHDLADMIEAFSVAKMLNRPCVVHVMTTKGKGYRPAEENPGEYHAVAKRGTNPPQSSFSETFGLELERYGKTDGRVCAITAAMKYATGLNFFSHACPERFFDAGIAEQHCVTFAAGLGAEGMIPVFAVYSTFLQRAYDQMIHDCAIEKNHVVLAIDRAGLVGEDGETHQGIFDVPMLSAVPDATVYSPASYEELRRCLKRAMYETEGVAAVRYPKGAEYKSLLQPAVDFSYSSKRRSTLAVSYGRISAWLDEAAEAADTDWLRLVKIVPLHEKVIEIALSYDRIVFFEESVLCGGIAEHFSRLLSERGWRGSFEAVGIEGFVPAATVAEQLSMFRLDKDSMITRLRG